MASMGWWSPDNQMGRPKQQRFRSSELPAVSLYLVGADPQLTNSVPVTAEVFVLPAQENQALR